MIVAIFMEGGGEKKETKAALRQGMEVFLSEIKDACRKRGWQWRLVCCGSRGEAYQRFRNESKTVDAGIVVLLVDSESNVQGTPIQHLAAVDQWNFDGVRDDGVHLMAQTMEAWIVADVAQLKRFYGSGFLENALPRSPNIEKVGKDDMARSLDRATRGSKKGKYHKIHHARQLLQNISPIVVRRRCSHCERLFITLLSFISHEG